MRNRNTRRGLALLAASCVVLAALACAGLWVAARQGVIELPEVRMSVGPLRIVTQAPQAVQCPPRQRVSLQRYIISCQQYKAQSAHMGSFYRIWIFASGQKPSLVTLLKLEFPTQR